ncbi:hypothetical protein [Sediminibacterium sp. C3]|nr:hypothetical protein [Sediminibacterium sp. C3]
MQNSYSVDLDESIRSDKKQLKQNFDHRQQFNQNNSPVTGNCVIVYPAINRKDYCLKLPESITLFLKTLGSQKVTLLDFVNTDFSDFPFETFQKRNIFKRISRGIKRSYVIQFSVDIIVDIFPLFFFSRRYDIPVILMISDGEVPVSLRLCDDGNLHLNFREKHHEQVIAAATVAGFVIGDIELCRGYSVSFL